MVFVILQGGCVTITKENVEAPLDSTKAYVQQYQHRGSWGIFGSYEKCDVTSVGTAADQDGFDLVKRGDQLFARVTPGKKRLDLFLCYSPKGMWHGPGYNKTSVVAELQANTTYVFAVERGEDAITIAVCEKDTGKVVSEKVSVGVSYTFSPPLLIPLL